MTQAYDTCTHAGTDTCFLPMALLGPDPWIARSHTVDELLGKGGAPSSRIKLTCSPVSFSKAPQLAQALPADAPYMSWVTHAFSKPFSSTIARVKFLECSPVCGSFDHIIISLIHWRVSNLTAAGARPSHVGNSREPQNNSRLLKTIFFIVYDAQGTFNSSVGLQRP